MFHVYATGIIIIRKKWYKRNIIVLVTLAVGIGRVPHRLPNTHILDRRMMGIYVLGFWRCTHRLACQKASIKRKCISSDSTRFVRSEPENDLADIFGHEHSSIDKQVHLIHSCDHRLTGCSWARTISKVVKKRLTIGWDALLFMIYWRTWYNTQERV